MSLGPSTAAHASRVHAPRVTEQHREIIAGQRPVLPRARPPRVLSIAGSDPSGGAGIQGDLKSIAAQGGYGMAVVTALTAQNTKGVRQVHLPPADFLAAQLAALSDDLEIDAVKIGMLSTVPVIRTVGQWLRRTKPPILVLDPVMVATSGDRLLDEHATAKLLELLSLADLVTPNLPELAVLSGLGHLPDWSEACDLARGLAEKYQLTVLLKGGHLPGPGPVPDALLGPGGEYVEVVAERIDSVNTHGTGCSLSSAMATLQVLTGDWEQSLRLAKPWLHTAIQRGAELGVGRGNGPVHHLHALRLPAGIPDRTPEYVQPESSQPESSQGTRRPAGVTQLWWSQNTKLLSGMMGLDFLRQLAEGTLPKAWFDYYLVQDALYLGGYSRVLARLSAMSPETADQIFWVNSARECLEVELQLHRDWLGARSSREREDAGGLAGDSEAGLKELREWRELSARPGPVTRTYIDHLQAACATGDYGVAAAAVLPSFWIYAWVGEQLSSLRDARDPHPYARWLDTYADEQFLLTTVRAIEIVERIARGSAAERREEMREAFQHSCQYEYDFFDAPRRYRA